MDEVTSAPRKKHPWLRRASRVLLALVVLIGGYVGYVAFRAAQPVTLPAPAGPYAVGRTILDLTDGTRTDPLAPRPGMPRELSVWLWYPASPGPGAQPAPYTPGAWAGLHLGSLPGLGETGFGNVHDHAFADVPAAPGRFPVAVLEPGMGFAAPQYTALAENLASHGYLVAGVTPTYSANLTVLNGRAVAATEAGNPPESGADDLHAAQAQTTGDRLVGIWAADASFTAARISALDRETGLFAGHVDAATTVYLGHSFGGAAALEACRSDAHCAGAADLDGTQYGTVVHSGLAKPMLLIGSEQSCVTGTCQPASPGDRSDRDTARALLTASTAPTWCYRINGAEHFDFSDYGLYYLAAPIRSQLALGPIDGTDALTITTAYLTAFLDHVSRGLPEPLLTGPPPYPQVEPQPR
ncbi:alpha/beta hydrolase [Amycolatopsis cynarae]|uniref:Alpha/beta hydrolase n=1 Tax=Amycolatopsis cynarae TaxID=2995223 RepID=A0ABY7AV40_9PSEU|nr:alpha/beta hydrolase [Amycolatopsis sp. HUAS 11-8]WAL63844.1 alpha/beta hydrolase [Amycolatopsis sp. HUAS 11-8]